MADPDDDLPQRAEHARGEGAQDAEHARGEGAERARGAVVQGAERARGAVAQRADPDDDLPVVARLVIEIRSDGTRTVARGGLEQADLGERIGVEARGGSPAALAADLLRAIISLPLHSSLSRWTGHERHVPKASIEPAQEPAPGVVGRVRQALTDRLRRKLGVDR